MPRDRFKRETALSVAQAVTTKRAYQHLAWAKGKDLRSRIRRLKEEEELIKAFKVLEPYSAFGGWQEIGRYRVLGGLRGGVGKH